MNEDTIKELVIAAVQQEAVLAWERIVLQLLDWPFLLFLLILIGALVFRRKILALFERSHIEFSWGKDKHIRLQDLSENIDQELDPVREELAELRSQIGALTHESVEGRKTEVLQEMSKEEVRATKDRMYKALRSPKFTWRSIEKLASYSRTSEDRILEFLAEDDNVVLGSDKAGRRLAKMKNR